MLAESFERSLQRQEVEATPLVQSAVAEVKQFAAMRQQQLQASIPDDLGKIHVEPDKIRDALTQLLINAVKFTPDGGAIRLSATRTPAGSLHIDVADTGMGIQAECLPRIFEPFFTRLDVSRHSSGTFEYDKRGLGLGLSVAKAFVEMHGGTLTVNSVLGKGTTFAMEVPTTAAVAPPVLGAGI